jgi:hypothetical protein
MISVLSIASSASGQENHVPSLPLTQENLGLVYCDNSENCFLIANATSVGTPRADDAVSAVEIRAANDIPTNETLPANGNSTAETTAESSDSAVTDAGHSEFSGSSTAASPDLSVGEEKDLISSGWN